MKVAEFFVSLQGEGASSGLPTAFVRTAGCNLRCSWCDTRHALEGGGEASLESLLAWARSLRVMRMCVTGGEPLLQRDAMEFARTLAVEGWEVEVETNGSLPVETLASSKVTVNMDYKLPSSGMEQRMLAGNLAKLRPCDQLKFVVADPRDFERAIEVMRLHPTKARVCMTPVGGTSLRWLADSILREGLDVRLYPQLHKLVWGARSGV